MCEIWRRPRAGGRATNGVTHPAWAVLDKSQSLPLWCGCRGRGGGALMLEPVLESLCGLGDDDEAHVRVLQAAILSTLTAKSTGRVGLQPGGREAAGDQISLPVEVGHPEAVNDIAGTQVD